MQELVSQVLAWKAGDDKAHGLRAYDQIVEAIARETFDSKPARLWDVRATYQLARFKADKIKHLVVPYTRGVGLDLGCGMRKAFPHFVGVDSCKDNALFGAQIRPDIQVESCEKLDAFADEACDFVFSSHLLEHIDDYKAALAEWWRVIKPGGHLVLYLPHKDFYPNVGEEGANPDHRHDFLPKDIEHVMEEIGSGCDLLVNEERNEGCEYSFLQVWKKTERGDCAMSHLAPKPAKTACVVRYGGFGDSIQAANILPALKREGFHVTFMTTPKGQDILKEDPHIDAWIIQDNDQVPNHELGDYFDAWRGRFDRFINLCESVEGTLLTMPGRINHTWPDNLRRQWCGRNYLEFTAELAGVPYASEARFYPTEEERAWAMEQVKDGGYHVMFALAGSSLHKFYPGQDQVIDAVLSVHPKATFHLVGDDACRILEHGWEDNPRVRCLSGELSIRQTLALAQVMDCVMGPETGVLNAVAFEPMRKVVLLSHSSHENLTKHWTNTAAIAAEVPCYPCHRLHYDDRWCPRSEETGAALCQTGIPPERVVQAILRTA